MPDKICRLENGIKLIHKEINTPVSHFGILINAGTRDEQPNESGIAHFVEHTIFKGTQKRKAYQILRRMEDVGGDLNASTSKEETYFHTSFLSDDYPRAVELLSDIFLHSVFPEKEIEKEKDVVLEEMKYYQDTPAEQIFDDFEALIFDNHPLGQAILGTKNSLKKFNKSTILNFIKQNYSIENMVLSSVGNISTQKLLHLCNIYFSEFAEHQTAKIRNSFMNYQVKTLIKHKQTNQTHVLLGLPAYSLFDDKKIGFMLLTNLLGGPGMNTRLNMAVREKKGLAYSIEASYSAFSDSGLFSIYIGSDNTQWKNCIELTFKEIKKIKHQKLGSLQLHYAKKQFLGQLAISNEAKLNEMLSNGRSALFFDEVETMEDVINQINTITSEDILFIANELFQQDQFSQLIFTK